jgi:membrane-bound lytic murein transglycosylase D
MPTELALLPFTESAFNPEAMSVAKASGMWQFIATTGRDYDLKQNLFRDDRRDVLASTRAALDYLEKLHNMFGDWQLALAAYNCGEGNVSRAIARNQRAGLPTDYTSLNLPPETRGYVPKLQAVKNIVLHPDTFSLSLPPLENHPYFLSVPIERDMDVETAARLAEVPLDEFKALNPQLNRPVILAAGTPQVLLPYDNADNFVRNLQRHEGPLATWTAWVATRTLRPADAAKQVGMTEAQLREVNHIPNGMLVKAGSTLLVPRGAHNTTDVSLHVADSAAMMLAPDLPPVLRVNVRVGRGGESVASVAHRYHVSASQVASWNHVGANGKFAAGSTAVVFVPRAASRGPARPTATNVAQASSAAHPAPAAHGKAAPARQASKTTVASASTAAKKPAAVAHKAPAASTAVASSKVRAKAPVRVAQP